MWHIYTGTLRMTRPFFRYPLPRSLDHGLHGRDLMPDPAGGVTVQADQQGQAIGLCPCGCVLVRWILDVFGTFAVIMPNGNLQNAYILPTNATK